MEMSAESSRNHRTIVLVGRTGNGKSATGNSILSEKVFKSRPSSAGVTSSCTLHKSKHNNLTVIDTPGLFDFTACNEKHGKEIVKCVTMADEGIHVILLVYSARNRFSREEQAVFECLKDFFGDAITKYVIVVFSGGDELEEIDETLEDYLGHDDCPKPLMEILQACGKRQILFDNKTQDEEKKAKQIKELLTLVEVVVDKNGGKPYTNDLFLEIQDAKRLREKIAASCQKGKEMEKLIKSHENKLAGISQLVDEKVKHSYENLQLRLTTERDELRKIPYDQMTESQKLELESLNELLAQLGILLAKIIQKLFVGCTIM